MPEKCIWSLLSGQMLAPYSIDVDDCSLTTRATGTGTEKEIEIEAESA
jgi:hypothetical protein